GRRGAARVLRVEGCGGGGGEAVGAVGVNGPGGAEGAEGGEGGGVVVRHGPSLSPARTPVKSRRKVRGAEHKSAPAVVAGALGSGGQPTRAGQRCSATRRMWGSVRVLCMSETMSAGRPVYSAESTRTVRTDGPAKVWETVAVTVRAVSESP